MAEHSKSNEDREFGQSKEILTLCSLCLPPIVARIRMARELTAPPPLQQLLGTTAPCCRGRASVGQALATRDPETCGPQPGRFCLWQRTSNRGHRCRSIPLVP